MENLYKRLNPWQLRLTHRHYERLIRQTNERLCFERERTMKMKTKHANASYLKHTKNFLQLQKQLEVYEFILSQLNSATGEIVDRELIVNSVKTSSLYKPMGVIDIGL